MACEAVIDFHTHVFPPWLRDERKRYVERDATFGEMYRDPKARMATADELITAMDEDGVHVSVVMGIGWADQGLARDVNDYVIESVARHPTRLVGFAGVSPAWGDAAVAEVHRCAEAGLAGVGELHPDTQRFDLGDKPTMAPLMRAARERGLIVTTHASEPVGHLYAGKGAVRPEVLWRFVQGFPENRIVCAHWGGGLPFYALMPEVKQALGNVYFDTAASPFLYNREVFSAVASVIGADRILVGSDYPLLRASRLLKQIDESTLSDQEKQAMKGGNGACLLGIA